MKREINKKMQKGQKNNEEKETAPQVSFSYSN